MSNYEYFELKYLEEVNDLFLNIKELNGHYNLGLFQGKRDNPTDLLEFIFERIAVLDEGSDAEEEEDRHEYD